MAGPATPDDRGETLLELVISVAIMGITVVAIVGGVATSILMTDIHRKQATAGTLVRNYAEKLHGDYLPCATAADYPATELGGYRTSVVTVQHWNGVDGWQPPGSTDNGLQQLTVQVSSDDGRAVERLAVVRRGPDGNTPCD